MIKICEFCGSDDIVIVTVGDEYYPFCRSCQRTTYNYTIEDDEE
jgi:hypothetical protein